MPGARAWHHGQVPQPQRAGKARTTTFTSRSAETGQIYGVPPQRPPIGGRASTDGVMALPTLQIAPKRGNPARQMVGRADYPANVGQGANA
jgi:hypothetical protein